VIATAGSDAAAALVAVVTAFCYTAGLAMQQRGNLDAMHASGADPGGGGGGALGVVKRPMWLFGNLVGFAGFGLQALALSLGAFLLVVPVLATQLAFMVPAGAWVVRSHVQHREWPPALAVLLGVAAFELAFVPQPNRSSASAVAWLVTVAVVAALFAIFFGAGRALPAYRAALYGCAAGTWAAMLGALLKELTGGAWWAAAAIVVAGPLNIFFLNVAIRAGRLSSAQTTVVAWGTVVSLVLGIALYGETVTVSAWRILGGLAAVAVAGWGIARLARSPSLLALDEAEHSTASN